MLVQASFAGVSPKYICDICHKPLSNPTSMAAGMGPVCRGKHGIKGGSTMGKKHEIDLSSWGSRFEYEGYHGCQSHCLILRKGNVVVCTEAPDNEGTSVTNCAEVIASKVCLEYGINPDELIWIEHYIHPFEDSGLPQETFDRCEFQRVQGDAGKSTWGRITHSIFESPQWKHLDRAETLALAGTPAADPSMG